MREIIFRGKRKDNGEWVNGDLLQIPSENWTSIMEQKKCTMNYIVDPETVGQYTGFNIDGRKVFEGDILRITIDYDDAFDHSHTLDEYFEVAWNNASGCWGLKQGKEFFEMLYAIDTNNARVVGNIYDNPELLEVEK